MVSQPVTGPAAIKAYDAQASDGFALSATTPVVTYHAAFMADASTGGVAGALAPRADASQSDRVNLLQGLTTPASGSHCFTVWTTMAIVGLSTETYGFSTVPAGTNGVQAVRTTLSPDGTTTTTTSVVQPAAVTAGTTATVNPGL